MTSSRLLDRRAFLADLGRGAFAIAVLGVAGCASAGTSGTARPSASAAGSSAPAGAGSPSASPAGPEPGSSSAPASAGGFSWTRVDLGFVSAYLLVRGGEAAVVDTGVDGSGDEIEASLGSVGLGWDAVGHVILTHRHPDHVGSVGDVLGRAPDAIGYAGAEDLAAIQAPRALTAVADGDEAFGLTIVATPGHTAGHVCVLDPVGGILVAGDALGTTGGTLAGSNPQFTEDVGAARASVAKLAALSFETLLVGHGDPIEGGASEAVAALAASG